MEILQHREGKSPNFLRNSVLATIVCLSTACSSIGGQNNAMEIDPIKSYADQYEIFKQQNFNRYLGIFDDIEEINLNKNYYDELEPLSTNLSEDAVEDLIESFLGAKNGDIIKVNGQNVVFIDGKGLDSEKVEDVVSHIPQSTIDELGLIGHEELVEYVTGVVRSNYLLSAAIENPIYDFKVMTISDDQAKLWLEDDNLNVFDNDINKARSTLIIHELGHLVYPSNVGHSNELLADLFSMKYAEKYGLSSENSFNFFYDYRNMADDGARSNHTNPYQYDVLRHAIDNNPDIFQESNLFQLYQMSEISNSVSYDILDQSLAKGKMPKILEHYFYDSDHKIIDIRVEASRYFNFVMFEPDVYEYKFEDLRSGLMGNHVFQKSHKEDAIKFMEYLENNIVDENGNFSFGDFRREMRGNDIMLNIVENTDAHNGYLKNRLMNNLLIDLYENKNSAVHNNLKNSAVEMGEYVSHINSVSYEQEIVGVKYKNK